MAIINPWTVRIAGTAIFRGGKWVAKKITKVKKDRKKKKDTKKDTKPEQLELDLKNEQLPKIKRHRDTTNPAMEEDPWTNRWVGQKQRRYGPQGRKHYGKSEMRRGLLRDLRKS